MLVVGVRSCGRDMDEGGGERETRRGQGFFGFGFRKGAEQMEKFFVWISVSSGEGEQGKTF